MAYEDSYSTYSNGNGVVNLPAIMGLGTAIRHLDAMGMVNVEAYNLRLRNRLADRLAGMNGLTLVSPPAGEQASPLLTAVLAERFGRGAVVQALLDRHQVAIRPTHAEFGFNGIRFSVHELNTNDDIDRAADALRRELAS
jgi:selenocysteine lyase/cysteine desulfurase